MKIKTTLVEINLAVLARNRSRARGRIVTEAEAVRELLVPWDAGGNDHRPIFRRVPGELNQFTTDEDPRENLMAGEIVSVRTVKVDRPKPKRGPYKHRDVRADLERCVAQ